MGHGALGLMSDETLYIYGVFGLCHLGPLLISQPAPAQNALKCSLARFRPSMPEGAFFIAALVMAPVTAPFAFVADPDAASLSENS